MTTRTLSLTSDDVRDDDDIGSGDDVVADVVGSEDSRGHRLAHFPQKVPLDRRATR